MTLEIANGQLPSELRDIIRGGKSVAFLGSGLSTACYGSWPELVNKLCEACGIGRRVNLDSLADELLDAAQEAKDVNCSAYYGFLGTHFGRPVGQGSILYDVLLSLPFVCYLTVNLDPLLAMQARTAGIKCDLPIHAYPSLDRKHMDRRSINYLHGFVGEGTTPVEGTIVLARDEFDAAYGPNGKVKILLIPTLEDDHVMFVGCGLREPPMRTVFEICKHHQRNRQRIESEQGRPPSNPPRRFILQPRPKVVNDQGLEDVERSQYERRKLEAYYKDMDIEIVWYRAVGDDHSSLRMAFDRIANLRSVTPDHGWR